MKSPLRPWIVTSLIGSLFATFPVLTASAENATHRTQPAKSAVSGALFQVVSIEGEAWVSSEGDRSARQPLATGDTLNEGSTIYTGPKSKLKLLLPGDIALEVQPDSEFKLVRKSPGSPDWGANLQRGGILSVVRNPAKRPSHFYIRTRSAAMGVRGTMFYVRSKEKEYDFFCDCMGSVTLQRPTDAKPTLITTQHHDSPQVVLTDGGNIQTAQSVNAPLDHSDEELAALKALLGPEPKAAPSSPHSPSPHSTGATKAR